MIVQRIDKALAERVVSAKHYSRRLGIFWEGYGLFEGCELLGVCCFGMPSAPIQKHAFTDRDFRLYELSRLVVEPCVKNGASYLIAHALRQLSVRPAAIISYADSAHGHCGIVYQATNWLYTGAVKAHDTLYLVNGVPTHPMTLRDTLGVLDPVRWAKDNGIRRVPAQPKHRYFTFTGDRKAVHAMRKKLRYPVIMDYPKADKAMYDAGPSMAILTGRDLA
jgi:hypothetical protein